MTLFLYETTPSEELKADPSAFVDALASALTEAGAEVIGAEILGEDLPDFLSGVRPQFLILQAAFCSGVGARSLTEAEKRLHGLGEFYADEHSALVALHDHMHAELHRLAVLTGDIDRRWGMPLTGHQNGASAARPCPWQADGCVRGPLPG